MGFPWLEVGGAPTAAATVCCEFSVELYCLLLTEPIGFDNELAMGDVLKDD